MEQGGAVVLERDTEIHGFGTKGTDRISLKIIGLTIRGARYELKDGTGAIDAQGPGGGGALEFDAGRVLEMWMSSRSAYARKK
jgi:hypothetical protein